MSRMRVGARQSPPRWIYRFLAGRPMDGKFRTSCSYLHRGTTALTETGRASRWAYMPGWKRQVLRLLAPFAVAALAWLYRTHPAVTVAGGGPPPR
jgi:hypothetical protein